MIDQVIERENGTIKAKVEIDAFGDQLLTTQNGWHWTGQAVTPELARMTIEVLEEYLSAYR